MSESAARTAVADSVDRAREEALSPLPWPGEDDDRARSKEFLPDGTVRYHLGTFYVDVASDGRIMVNRDDWLSKYTMAIDGTLDVEGKFARLQEGKQIAVENDNLIRAGEILIHLATGNPAGLTDTGVPARVGEPRSMTRDSGILEIAEIRAENEFTDQMLDHAARLYPNVSRLDEAAKQDLFVYDAQATVAILMYEFGTGTGAEVRAFDERHAIVRVLMDSTVGNELEQRFCDSNAGARPGDRLIALDGNFQGYGFSPDQVSVKESIAKHVTALSAAAQGNEVELFIGGASYKISVNDKADKYLAYIQDAKTATSFKGHTGSKRPRVPGVPTRLGSTTQQYRYSKPIPWLKLAEPPQ